MVTAWPRWKFTNRWKDSKDDLADRSCVVNDVTSGRSAIGCGQVNARICHRVGRPMKLLKSGQKAQQKHFIISGSGNFDRLKQIRWKVIT